MKLHVDLETLQLIEGPGFRNPVTALRFKRGDSARLEVSFLEGGSTPASIGNPLALEIQFGIKPRNCYDAGYLVHSADWTMPAPEAESPVYLCSPSFNTVELDSALGVGSSTGTELSEITLMGEITWREGAGEPTSTRTFLVIVENDVNRGTEGVPTDADPAYPAPEALLLKSELDQRAVRHDAAQPPLNATQLAQFLDNLGRSAGVLDLGNTTLVVQGLSGSMGSLNIDGAYAVDSYGGQSLDWNMRTLLHPYAYDAIGEWGYDAVPFFNVYGEYRSNGYSGVTGTFFDVNGSEVYVEAGIIVGIGTSPYSPWTPD